MRERAIDAREHLFFPENFEQMIQTRAGIAAGDRKPRRMNKRADFHAEIRRGRLERRFDLSRVKVLQRGERVAQRLQARLVFRDEMFRNAFGIVVDLVGEIEAAISGQLIKDLDLSFAGIERGAHVICGKFVNRSPRECNAATARS